MRFPLRILIRVLTPDGVPAPGMFVNIRVRMKRKNDYDLAFGPSDGNGEITVTGEDIVKEARQVANFFLMDYADIKADSTGEIMVRTFVADDVRRAILAYREFARV